MKNKIVLFCLLLFMLSACGGTETPTDLPTLDATQLHETAIYLATKDATLQHTSEPTQTLRPTNTRTPIPTLDRTRPLIQSPTPEIPCDRAAAGQPIDVTIPDGTIMVPGQSFLKTWRLVNVGSCTWTRQYAVTFFSGNSLNAIHSNPILQPVEPGGIIDVTVNMEAPQTPGLYQSNWMLSNASGALFGIGPNGDAPFWVKIEVVPAVTDTPRPTPTVTSTPVVYLTGEEIMASGDQLDLDSGTLNPEDVTRSDFIYQTGTDPAHILLTMNGMQWVVIGEEEPSYGKCIQSQLSGNAISFNEVPEGTYLCYRTSGSLPGWLLLEGLEPGGLSVSFLTWSVP